MSQYFAAVWLVIITIGQWVAIVVGAIFVLVFLASLLTYGRAVRPSRRTYHSPAEELIQHVWLISIAFMHGLIDRLRGIRPGQRGEQQRLSDQQIIGELRRMSSEQFTEVIAHLFTAMGYYATVVREASENEVSIELWKNEKLSLVQCRKQSTQRVTPEDVRELFAAMEEMNADQGYVVTTAFFTYDAEQFAEGKPIHCIDAFQLAPMLREYHVLGMSSDAQSLSA